MELELRGISKFFGKFQAVKSVSFAIERGELFSMVGPSGCGKTTILRMIAGFLLPEEGQVILEGQDITFAPINKRGTAMVFQNYAIFPHMNVFDNLAFGLRMHKVSAPEIRQRVTEVLGLIRLPGIEEKYPSQLSGGQQQRVALARALVIRPEVLLLDEPLSNLDAKLRESLRMEIREIQQQVRITTIFVTHDIGEAFAMSDRIAVMNAGEIVQISNPIGIYESPVNEFVGSFVGKSNQFDAVVEEVRDDLIEVRVNDNFPMVFHKNNGHFEKQQQVRLMVRPERITIADHPSGCRNSFPGVVQRAYYLGSQTHYEVNVAECNIIIEHYNDRKERFHQGDRVFVEWESEDCVCYS